MSADTDILSRFLSRMTGRSRENYATDLGLWQRWADDHGVDITTATRQDVEEWLAQRRDAGISPRTAATNLSHLRGYYRWLHREGVRDDDPTALVDRPTYGRTERPWLGRHDTRRLLDASLTWSDGEMAAHVHLWALSGLRPGEPRRLRVEDLGSLDGRPTLSVDATKTPGRERLLLPASTAQLLDEAADGRRRGALLIHPRTGRPWTKGTEQGRLARLLEHAGLPPVTAYGLRTGFITLALAAGLDERLVMISARHTSTYQTARYDRMRDQVERGVGPALADWLSSPQGDASQEAPR